MALLTCKMASTTPSGEGVFAVADGNNPNCSNDAVVVGPTDII